MMMKISMNSDSAFDEYSDDDHDDNEYEQPAFDEYK